jgi:CheY-like chemotaxis protein
VIRILLVEDSDAVARVTVRTLGPRYLVERAVDGEEARARVKGGAGFDVVLSDVEMPRMSGLDLLRWMRAEVPALALRCLFLTADPDLPEAKEIARTHLHPILLKGCTREALHAAIATVLAPREPTSGAP